MSFALADGFHAGLDCAGEIVPGLGAAIGWMMHGPDDLLDVGAESSPGAALPVLLLSFHPRPDLAGSPGLAVTGFVLVHEASREHAGLLVLRAGGRSARVDLRAHDVSADVPAALAASAGSGAFDLLAATVAAPGRLPLLGGDGRGLGPFARYLARQASVLGEMDWFGAFRRVAVHRLPLGEVVLGGSLVAPGAGDATEVAALALVTARDAATRVLPLGSARSVGMPEGFVLHGFVDGVAEDDVVELVTLVRRGGDCWTFRAMAAPAPLDAFLMTLGLQGFEIPDARALLLERWFRDALDIRLDALREPLSRLSILRGDRPEGRGTALVFDLDEPLAVRLLALLAPALQERFDRIVVTGASAARAAAAFHDRPGLQVIAETDPKAAIAAAAAFTGTVVPADAASLAAMAIARARPGEGHVARGGPGLDPARLDEILLLHGIAGLGDVAATLRRVTAILEGGDAAPAREAVGPAGGAVAAHLAAIWRAALPVGGRGS